MNSVDKKLEMFFKSVLEQDHAAIVICNLDHEIIYMNPAAIQQQSKHGGSALIGKSLLACHNAQSCARIQEVVDWFLQSEDHNIIYTFYNEKHDRDVYMVALRNEKKELIGYYEKHEYRSRETASPYDFS